MPRLFQSSSGGGNGIVGISCGITGRIHQLLEQTAVLLAARQEVEEWRLAGFGYHFCQPMECILFDAEQIGESHVLAPDALQVELTGIACQLFERGGEVFKKLPHPINVALLTVAVVVLADAGAENFSKTELIGGVVGLFPFLLYPVKADYPKQPLGVDAAVRRFDLTEKTIKCSFQGLVCTVARRCVPFAQFDGNAAIGSRTVFEHLAREQAPEGRSHSGCLVKPKGGGVVGHHGLCVGNAAKQGQIGIGFGGKAIKAQSANPSAQRFETDDIPNKLEDVDDGFYHGDVFSTKILQSVASEQLSSTQQSRKPTRSGPDQTDQSHFSIFNGVLHW